MPVYSMTGYASAQHSAAAASPEPDSKAARRSRLGLEIRSVNSRFLDLTFRLPEELRQHEPALRELLTAKLKRGKVEVRAGAGEHRRQPPCANRRRALLQRLNAMQDSVPGLAARCAAAQRGRRPPPGCAPRAGADTDWSQSVTELATTSRCKPCWPPANAKAPGWRPCCSGIWPSCASWPLQAGPLVPQAGRAAAQPLPGALEGSHGADRRHHPARSGAGPGPDRSHRLCHPHRRRRGTDAPEPRTWTRSSAC